MWWNGLSLLLEGNAMLEGTSIATVSFSFSSAPALFQISFMKLPTLLWLNLSISSNVTPHQSGLYDSIFLNDIYTTCKKWQNKKDELKLCFPKNKQKITRKSQIDQNDCLSPSVMLFHP